MTKEELKKEAEKGLDKRLGTYAYINKQNCYRNYVDGYIDGAEPREKRITELERNVAYYAERAKHAELAGRDYVLENKDLGKRCLQLRNERNTFLAQNEQYEKDLIDFNETLTKAKEIIRNLLSAYTTYADSFDDRDNEIVDEAEQFLSEVNK